MFGESPVIGLQFGNGLVGPVGMFDLVQLCLREGVVEVLNGHLIEGDHVLKLIQLKKKQIKKKTEQNERENSQIFANPLKLFMKYFGNIFNYGLTSCSY